MIYDTSTVTNLMRKHPITSLSQLKTFLKEIESLLPSRTDKDKPIFEVRFSGFGSRADPEAMHEAAKKSMAAMGIEKGDRKILFFDGDNFSMGSFTSVVHSIWKSDPNNTVIVPVRGPPREGTNHDGFFESWTGIPIYLLELTEDMRTESLKHVTEIVGPDSASRASLRILDEKQRDYTKLGWWCILNLPLDAIISLGGGDTTGNEAKMYTAYKEANAETVIAPKWFVHTLDRAGAKEGDERQKCDEFLVTFKMDMDAEMAKKKGEKKEEEEGADSMPVD